MHSPKLACILWLTFSLACWAQNVQGEDPVSVQQRVQNQMLPWSASAPVNLPQIQEIPAWLDAKLARFQAKAFSANTEGVLTDHQVTNTTLQDGLRKTCIQDIGSSTATNTASNRYGPRLEAQIVVLRGDLVNICR